LALESSVGTGLKPQDVESSYDNDKQASPTSAQFSRSKRSGFGDTPEIRIILALRAVIDAKTDVFNYHVETIPRLYKRVRSQAIFERSYGFLSSFVGRTSSFFPSSKTTNEVWANRQQRKTIPARFSVFVLLMKLSH
jgi:hypothetical protein